MRRLLPSSRERLAALVLALFAVSPAAPVLGWIANQSQPDHNQLALKEMYRQVGPLELDEEGIARRGLLIRHLVMPEDISGTREVLSWIAQELGPDTPISLMDQYFPAWKAVNDPLLNRRLTWAEYRSALDALDELNFTAGYVQEDLVELDATADV